MRLVYFLGIFFHEIRIKRKDTERSYCWYCRALFNFVCDLSARRATSASCILYAKALERKIPSRFNIAAQYVIIALKPSPKFEVNINGLIAESDVRSGKNQHILASCSHSPSLTGILSLDIFILYFTLVREEGENHFTVIIILYHDLSTRIHHKPPVPVSMQQQSHCKSPRGREGGGEGRKLL